MAPLPLVLGPVIFVLMIALYGFVLWLIYRITTSLERISQSLEEVTHLLRQGPGRTEQPPQ